MKSPEIQNEHGKILDSLRLELKIACDGHPELHGLEATELCRRFYGTRSPDARRIYEAAAPVCCHELYFSHILPEGEYSLPDEGVSQILSKSFGSADNFFYLVRTISSGTAAPGFLWLYEKMSCNSHKLGLSRLPLYNLPDLRRLRPLFCIDLWEHAYIGTHGCDIAAYADSVLRRLDWNGIFSQIQP